MALSNFCRDMEHFSGNKASGAHVTMVFGQYQVAEAFATGTRLRMLQALKCADSGAFKR